MTSSTVHSVCSLISLKSCLLFHCAMQCFAMFTHFLNLQKKKIFPFFLKLLKTWVHTVSYKDVSYKTILSELVSSFLLPFSFSLFFNNFLPLGWDHQFCFFSLHQLVIFANSFGDFGFGNSDRHDIESHRHTSQVCLNGVLEKRKIIFNFTKF